MAPNPEVFFGQQQCFRKGRALSEWEVHGLMNGMALGSCTLRDAESVAWVIHLHIAKGEL